MKTKCDQIDLPFELATLSSELKEMKKLLEQSTDEDSECNEDLDLLFGVIENLLEMIKPIKDINKADKQTQISLLAHYFLLQDLVNALQDADDFDDVDLEDDDEFDEDDLDEEDDEDER